MLRLDFGVHNLQGSDSAASRWNAGVPRKVDLVLPACAGSKLSLLTAVFASSVAFSQPHLISATIEEQSLGSLSDVVTVRSFSANIYSYPVQ
jgi:hypothetical protein